MKKNTGLLDSAPESPWDSSMGMKGAFQMAGDVRGNI
jgi:hypothetical protein